LKNKEKMDDINSIYIDNITEKDADSGKIRILKGNKFLFPEEKIGVPSSYCLKFVYGEQILDAKYRIGSADCRSRSGVLRFKNEHFYDVLKVSAGSLFRITKAGDLYRIEKLSKIEI